MKKLSELTPYVGDSMNYTYVGNSNEKLRAGDVYAFHLFHDGPGEIEVTGIRYPIERKTLIFLRPGEPHAFHVESGQRLSSYNIYCDLWDTANPLSPNRGFIRAPDPFKFDQLAVTLPCPELDSLPSTFSLQPYPWLYEAFVTLSNVYSSSFHYRIEMVNQLLYAWILGWYNVIHTQQPTDYRIVKLLTYLNEHPEEPASIESWAEFCSLKRSYFYTLFVKETGLTPKAYYHNLVMRRAANLLQETKLSITDISTILGYVSVHPFTRHFSAYYGISPRQYRQQQPYQ